MKKRFFLPLLFFLSAALRAHPHVWIDVITTPRQNEHGEIIALQQQWRFDPMYSAVFIQEIEALSAEEGAARLAQIEADTLGALDKEGYYTYPRETFAAAQKSRLYIEEQLLLIEVELPLQHPMRELRYQIYEPAYYVEILHSPEQSSEHGGCRLSLEEGAPDDDSRAQAAADTFDLNLGRVFAQRAHWSCP